MVLSEEIARLVEEWLSLDKNESTRSQIQQLVSAENEKELRKLLCTRMAFGTAGLRSRMGAGYACMNDVTVLQTSQGLCAFIEQQFGERARQQGIVVGFDGRHNSRTFASITAAVFLSRGFLVYLYDCTVPTPFVPFAISNKGMAAGVMITASHNPKDDNGYKVYWSNGAQIISPIDKGIAEQILRNLKPWDGVHEIAKSLRDGTFSSKNLKNPDAEGIIDSYFAQSSDNYCWKRADNQKSTMKFTYTAMHGVGTRWVTRAFSSFSLPPFVAVSEQADPDPNFSTVSFPNPEEGKGALALAIATANRVGSSVILANDPDADRLAVAEKQQDGEWKIFSGNEIALLLANWTWVNYLANRHPNAEERARCVMLASTVSSKAIRAMAQKEGFVFEETLTGFKWMGNKAYEHIQAGKTFLFAYEVEIGFLVGDISLDKDGVRTAAIFAEMSNHVYAHEGITLTQKLHRLYEQYGFYVMNTRYFFCYSPDTMRAIFDRIRTAGPDGKYVRQVGETRIQSIRDLTIGYDDAYPDRRPKLPVDPSSQMITFTFEDGSVCTLRASGTEPKLKYYVEVADQHNEKDARLKLDKLTRSVISELLRPELNGLVPPKD